MTKLIDETKKAFFLKLDEYIESYNQYEELKERLARAEENIVTLEEEKEKLKQKRPYMLARKKDVSELNKRLKNIDEEIEINKDTIIGINAIYTSAHNEQLTKRQDANKAFQIYMDKILLVAQEEYLKVAPNLAEIIKEYMALENIRNGKWRIHTVFNENSIKYFPSFNSKKTIFKNDFNTIAENYKEKVKEKYNIPDFEVRPVELNHYL